MHSVIFVHVGPTRSVISQLYRKSVIIPINLSSVSVISASS